MKSLKKIDSGNHFEISLSGETGICLTPIGMKHRISNNTDKNLYLIETQIGSYLGEDDIKRYDDDYGRT